MTYCHYLTRSPKQNSLIHHSRGGGGQCEQRHLNGRSKSQGPVTQDATDAVLHPRLIKPEGHGDQQVPWNAQSSDDELVNACAMKFRACLLEALPPDVTLP